MSEYIYTYLGMWLVQSIAHSVIAAAVADFSLLAWRNHTPLDKQRLRMFVIAAPVFSFPLYTLLNPGRQQVYFRIDSLFDTNRWLVMEFWEGFSLLNVLAGFMAFTTLVFVVQELLPLAMNLLEGFRSGPLNEAPLPPDDDVIEKTLSAIEKLPIEEDRITIFPDDDLALFSTTGLKPRVFVSTGLVRAFSRDQLEAAIAHEIGHIIRSRKPVLIIVYLLRVLMFYNPIAMIEFRRVAEEEEKICDDLAVDMTGNPEALAGAIAMLLPARQDEETPGAAQRLEQYGHGAMLNSRIERIVEDSCQQHDEDGGVQFIITAVVIFILNFNVV